MNHIELKKELLDIIKTLNTDLQEDDAEIAIYWYANLHYRSQTDPLYSILSTSPYNPGPIMTLKKEDETIRTLYRQLAMNMG